MSNTLCCTRLQESADRECQALGILAGLRLCERTFGRWRGWAGLAAAGSVCPVQGVVAASSC